jgi:hypothetical protein
MHVVSEGEELYLFQATPDLEKFDLKLLVKLWGLLWICLHRMEGNADVLIHVEEQSYFAKFRQG